MILDEAAKHGVDWWTWRIAGDSRIGDGLFEVRYRYRFRDMYEAHRWLDAMDALRARADRG